MRELFDEVAGQSPLDPHEAVRQSTRGLQRKRFYAGVAVEETPEGFAILLDGKSVKTPSRKPLIVPVRAIADVVAGEWAAQGDHIDPVTMPMTRLANSVIEGVVDRVDDVVADMAKFLETDLLCYRAGRPQALVALEAAAWDPILFWAAETYDAHFILAEGVMHVRQPAPAVAAARSALPAEPWAVAALHVVTTLTGSALLALALYHRRLSAEDVWAAAHVDEDWNIQQWGVDDEVAARRAARRIDFYAAAALLDALPRSAG